MRILRANERTAVPWKNGGGVTSEVAVFPPGAGFDDFGWRISIARIERGGPFSLFPGIDRTLAMLEGRVTLTIEGRTPIALSPQSPPVQFPGDTATSAELIGDDATDLNVMTRRDVFFARIAPAEGSCVGTSGAAATLFVARAEAALHEMRLAPGDAVMLDTGESLALPPGGAFLKIEIFPAENRPKAR